MPPETRLGDADIARPNDCDIAAEIPLIESCAADTTMHSACLIPGDTVCSQVKCFQGTFSQNGRVYTYRPRFVGMNFSAAIKCLSSNTE